MDPEERDASKLRRQESLAQRLGEALDRITPHDARQCPDPEIIAAYAEQTLDPAESAGWEGHFAACARCRNILRVLAASADTPLADKEVAQIGELVAAAARPSSEISGPSADRARPKVVRWPTRWLAPALGVAAALAVWFAMRPPSRSVDHGSSGTLVAQAPREEIQTQPATPPASAEPEKVAPQAEQKTESAVPVDRSRAAAAPLNAPAEIAPQREAGKGPDTFSPSAGAATGALQDEKKLDRFAEGRQNQTTAVAPAPPSPPPARLAMPAPAAPQAEAKAASGAVTGGLPPATASANAVENGPAARDKQADAIQAQQSTSSSTMAQAEISPQVSSRKQQAFGVARSLQPNSSLMIAPADLVHWRAGKGGVIQRSVDAGRTWTGQTSPSKEDWLAGAAFSDTVCWLAGRHGAIARTTDGQTWQTILPPVQAAGAGGNWPDWTGITASDAQTAVVTASDGRKFGTTDGGKTWQPQ